MFLIFLAAFNKCFVLSCLCIYFSGLFLLVYFVKVVYLLFGKLTSPHMLSLIISVFI